MKDHQTKAAEAVRKRRNHTESRLRLGLLFVVLGLLVAGAVSAVTIGRGEPTDSLLQASPASEPTTPPTTPPLEASPASEPTTPPTTPPLEASPAAEATSTAAAPSTAGPTTSTAPANGKSPTPKPSVAGVSTVPTRAAPGSTATSPAPVPTAATTRAATPTTRPTPTTVPAAGNTANDALNALNRDRLSQGLPALRVRSDLQTKAQSWAEKLARENALYHSNLRDGLAPCWTGLGENIANASSVTQAEQLLMGDPPHRANILGRWNWVGVGVARTSRGVVVVQVFMSGCL